MKLMNQYPKKYYMLKFDYVLMVLCTSVGELPPVKTHMKGDESVNWPQLTDILQRLSKTINLLIWQITRKHNVKKQNGNSQSTN